MEEEIKKEETWCDELKTKIEDQMKHIMADGINLDNVEYLYKLADIHKDFENEIYWKEKIKMYREGNYNEGYGRRGRYRDGSYGRRGVKGTGRGRYRGEEAIDEMYMNYGEYSEGKENYGADQETLKSLEKMLESVKKFMKHLKKEAQSQEEFEMIKETAEEISEM